MSAKDFFFFFDASANAISTKKRKRTLRFRRLNFARKKEEDRRGSKKQIRFSLTLSFFLSLLPFKRRRNAEGAIERYGKIVKRISRSEKGEKRSFFSPCIPQSSIRGKKKPSFSFPPFNSSSPLPFLGRRRPLPRRETGASAEKGKGEREGGEGGKLIKSGGRGGFFSLGGKGMMVEKLKSRELGRDPSPPASRKKREASHLNLSAFSFKVPSFSVSLLGIQKTAAASIFLPFSFFKREKVSWGQVLWVAYVHT